jgi:hypothetical protein
VLAIALISLITSAQAETRWSVSPIIVEGLPSDALEADPVVPATETRTRQSQGSGTVQRSLQNEMPFTFTDSGRPGEVSQIRGLGLGVEENSTEVFGVPLSPPQGGGFNLATFPQYLWSGAKFRLGPSLAGLDPRGVSGTLTLVPWTQEALSRGQTGARFTQNYSSLSLGQTSVGGAYNDRVAAIAGYTYGEAEGPAGAASARWKLTESVRGKIHLLASNIDAPANGAPGAFDPNARLETTRAIPVAQVDVLAGPDTIWKSSAYLDFGRLRYADPDTAFVTDDRVTQWGAQTAVVTGSTRFGGSFRQADLRQIGFTAPTETSGSLQLSHAYERDAWLVEPSLQGVGVSGFGFLPAGSLGVKWSPIAEGSLYARASYTRRFASLIDRFYQFTGYTPNPGLRPERTFMVLYGGEWRLGSFKNSLEGYGQLRQDAQIRPLTFTGPFNGGQGRIAALVHRLEFQAGGGFALRHAVTVASSHLDDTGRAFPFIPGVLEVLGVGWQSSPDNPRVSATSTVRLANRAEDANPGQIPGYGWWDLGGAVGVTRAIRAELTVENVLDRRLELKKGYPQPGRVFSVALVGEID